MGGGARPEIPDGLFGENLTTSGFDVNEAEVGERWRVGNAVLEVASVRIPCNDFKGWMGESGFDNTAWVKRFAANGRPGPYLRVLLDGVLAAGDTVEVVHRPDHGVTVSTMFRALTGEQSAAAPAAGRRRAGGGGPRARREVRRRVGDLTLRTAVRSGESEVTRSCDPSSWATSAYQRRAPTGTGTTVA